MIWGPSRATITQVSTESGPGFEEGKVLTGGGREALGEVADSFSYRTEGV